MSENSEFQDIEKQLLIVNKATGEVKGRFVLPKKSLGMGWVGMYQAAAINLAKMKLSKDEYRVLLYLFGKLDYQNHLAVSQREMAEELGIHRQNIYKAMRGLVEANIIVPGDKVGLNNTYRLNADLAHKGANVKETRQDYTKLRKAHAVSQKIKEVKT